MILYLIGQITTDGGTGYVIEYTGEAVRVLLRGRRLVVEREDVAPAGVTRQAVGQGLWVGERR